MSDNDVQLPDVPGVVPHLVCDGAARAIDFYKEAFGAEEEMRLAGPDGKLAHASVVINGHMVMLMDEFVDMGATSPNAWAAARSPCTSPFRTSTRRSSGPCPPGRPS